MPAAIVKMIKDKKLKVQAAMQENQVRVTGKKIDDLAGSDPNAARGSEIDDPVAVRQYAGPLNAYLQNDRRRSWKKSKKPTTNGNSS